MSVDCELTETNVAVELCDIAPASNDVVEGLETYLGNVKPDAEITMDAGTLKSLLKRTYKFGTQLSGFSG
jgi:hypothetical protein